MTNKASCIISHISQYITASHPTVPIVLQKLKLECSVGLNCNIPLTLNSAMWTLEWSRTEPHHPQCFYPGCFRTEPCTHSLTEHGSWRMPLSWNQPPPSGRSWNWPRNPEAWPWKSHPWSRLIQTRLGEGGGKGGRKGRGVEDREIEKQVTEGRKLESSHAYMLENTHG